MSRVALAVFNEIFVLFWKQGEVNNIFNGFFILLQVFTHTFQQNSVKARILPHTSQQVWIEF